MGHFYSDLNPLLILLFTGLGIFKCCAFILAWPQVKWHKWIFPTLALAVVAFIAVLPEYAVDMYFTWMAGQDPESAYSYYAIANMTGANCLRDGIVEVIAILYWLKYKRWVLTRNAAPKCFFWQHYHLRLCYSTKGSLAWYDAIIFVGMYVYYIRVISKRPAEEEE